MVGIKMGRELFLLASILLVALVKGEETTTTSSTIKPTVATELEEKLTEDVEKFMESTGIVSYPKSKITNKKNLFKNLKKEENPITPSIDNAKEVVFETFLTKEEEKLLEEIEKESEAKREDATTTENSVGTKFYTTTEAYSLRRQGDIVPLYRPRDSRTLDKDRYPSVQSFGGSTKSKVRNEKGTENENEAPFLQLTQGGYKRPYQVSKPNKQEKPDISKKPEGGTSTNIRTPVGNPDGFYSNSMQPQPIGFRPLIQSPFLGPPPNLVGGNFPFFNQNARGPELTSNLQTPFPFGNDARGRYNIGRDTKINPLFDTRSRLYPNTDLLMQHELLIQPQQVVTDPMENLKPHFFSTPHNPFRDSVNLNYGAPLRNGHPDGLLFLPPITNNRFLENTLLSQRPFNFPGRINRPILPLPFSQDNAIGKVQKEQNFEDKRATDVLSEKEKLENFININRQPIKDDPLNSESYREKFPLGIHQDVFLRYPVAEAGYATEESLPVQNMTLNDKENPAIGTNPFAKISKQSGLSILSGRDPYRDALNSLRRKSPMDKSETNNEKNDSYDFNIDEVIRNRPLPFTYSSLYSPRHNLSRYPNNNLGISGFPGSPFYIPSSSSTSRSMLDRPESDYGFLNPAFHHRISETSSEPPPCALKNNASICFEDDTYPRNDILYSMNSDSYLLDRLMGSDPELKDVIFVEGNGTQSEAEENYICKTDIKYGQPLRAKNVLGTWKTIVNFDGSLNAKLRQIVRMEVCRDSGEPCRFTTSPIKTSCVQKYHHQRLISWSPTLGLHVDVYSLPVACSCQIENTKEI